MISRPEGRSDIRADVQRRGLCLLLADLVIRRVAARSLSRGPTDAGQFRTCLASLMVTDIGDDASWNVSAGDVGTVLGIAHRAGYDRVWIAGRMGCRRTCWASDPDPQRPRSRRRCHPDGTRTPATGVRPAWLRGGGGLATESRCTHCGRRTPGRCPSNRLRRAGYRLASKCRGSGAVPVSRGRLRPGIDRRTSGGLPVCVAATAIPPWLCSSANPTITTSPC